MKLKLNSQGLKQFLLRNVEKMVFAVVVLCFASSWSSIQHETETDAGGVADRQHQHHREHVTNAKFEGPSSGQDESTGEQRSQSGAAR